VSESNLMENGEQRRTGGKIMKAGKEGKSRKGGVSGGLHEARADESG